MTGYKKCLECKPQKQTVFDCQMPNQGREYDACYASPLGPGSLARNVFIPSSLKSLVRENFQGS